MKRGKWGGNKRKAARSLDPAEAARLQASIERTGKLTNAEVAQASSLLVTSQATDDSAPAVTSLLSAPCVPPHPYYLQQAYALVHMFQVLRADTVPCTLYDKTCKGKADNPNCLCGLIPAPESHRRQGLWQKDVAAMLKLGADPSAAKREVRSTWQVVLCHAVYEVRGQPSL